MDRYQVQVRGCMPPLNLMYLAACLRRDGHEVDIVDLYAEPLSLERLFARVGRYSPDVVGLSSYTANVDQVLELARSLKGRFPKLVVVVGGIHASYLPQTVLASPHVDFVIRGEGEAVMPELVRALEVGADFRAVKGLSWREGGMVVSNPPGELLLELDALPFPAYELVDLDRYYLSVTRAVTFGRVASILTMRGCPYRCSFCSHHYGYGLRVRKRSVSNVIDEIRLLREKYGVCEFQFEDSSFTCDPARVIEICAEIERQGLEIIWNCNVRADTASDVLFRAMKAAGCERILLGVESGSQRMLDAMKKSITLAQIREAVTLARKHKIGITCSFVLGTPGETRESAEETYRFALELDPDYAMFSSLVPSTGSELFDVAVREGAVDVEKAYGADFITVYSERDPIVAMSELSGEELGRLMERYTRGFYLRPRYILRRLLGLRNWTEATATFWGVVMVFRHQFRFLAKSAGERR